MTRPGCHLEDSSVLVLSLIPQPFVVLVNPHSVDKGLNLNAINFLSSFQNKNVSFSAVANSASFGGFDLSSTILSAMMVVLLTLKQFGHDAFASDGA